MPTPNSGKPPEQAAASREQHEKETMSQVRTTDDLPVGGKAACLPGRRKLTHNGNFEPESDRPELTEQLGLTGDALCGLHHCALKKQNPTRDKSKHIMKILRLDPKNREKKRMLFLAERSR